MVRIFLHVYYIILTLECILILHIVVVVLVLNNKNDNDNDNKKKKKKNKKKKNWRNRLFAISPMFVAQFSPNFRCTYILTSSIPIYKVQ